MKIGFALTSQKFRGVVGLFAVAFLLIFCGGQAKAATSNGPIGLMISPVKIPVNVEPGQTYTFKVSPFNITDSSLVLTPLINDFTSKDETGTPKVLLEGALPPSSSLKSWLTLSSSSPFELAPKTAKPVIVTLKVPQNAEPGGHYGVVRFTGAGIGQNEDNVALVASWGTLVLVRVNGKITEKLDVVDFYTTRGGNRSGWFEKGPVDFIQRIKNSGNVHVEPKGNITVTDMFGNQVGSVVVNDTNGNILPNSIRKFNQSFKKSRMFGRYNAKFNLSYGTKGEILSSSLSFWVIPYKLVIVVLIIIVLLVLLSIWGIKRYNRKIVRRAYRR